MLQRTRELLTLVLIGLLPFHALLITVATKLILGPGHAPMPMLAGWKEGLLAIILVITAVEILIRITNHESRITKTLLPDVLDSLILALILISLFLPKTNYLFGFKYDFVPLIAFVILRRVPWSAQFLARAQNLLLIVGGIIAAYGIVSIFLPMSFFMSLGYSDAHSLYQPNGPLAAFQMISETTIRRIQGSFSGPNQLGIWLLIPLSVLAVRIPNSEFRIPNILLGGVFLAALVLTFSRSAWIAAAVVAAILVLKSFTKKKIIFGVASAGIVVVLVGAWMAPSIFIRGISLAGHLERPLQAINVMLAHPFGLGLGSAGPAANRTHPACVFLNEGDDPAWAKSNPDLCVFVGAAQVQPATPCDCPLIPENWYLQIGVELGVMGFVAYLLLVLLVLWKLRITNYENFAIRNSQFAFFALLGIGIAALFLHAWEDAAAAYTAWMAVAITLRSSGMSSPRRP